MAVHACCLAILVATSLVGASDTSLRIDEAPLIAGDPVLADVNQLTVVLVTGETPGVEGLIDATKLTAQVWQKLRDAGMTPVEQNSESTPRLLVQIEGTDVPDSDKYVYRVQTGLCRLVTVPGQGESPDPGGRLAGQAGDGGCGQGPGGRGDLQRGARSGGGLCRGAEGCPQAAGYEAMM